MQSDCDTTRDLQTSRVNMRELKVWPMLWQSDWRVLYAPGLNHCGEPQRLPGLALAVNCLPVTMSVRAPAFKCSPFASTTPSTPMLASCLNHPPSMYLRALPFQISTICPPPQQLVSSLNHPPTVTIVYLLVGPRFHITSTTCPPQPCLGAHSLSRMLV